MTWQVSELFWRRLFLSGAIFNWSAAAVLAIWHRELGRLLGLAPAAEPAMYLHLFALAVAVFGWAYFMVSQDLNQVALVRLGAFTKLGVTAIVCAFWWAGTASWHLPALTAVDLSYAAFFFAFLRRAETSV
ncbi:MAG: hypothetical protein V4508_01295 [Pseudomonadota bacterium]